MQEEASTGGGAIRFANEPPNLHANEVGLPYTIQSPNKIYGSDGEALIFPSLFTPPTAGDSAYVKERFERLKVKIRPPSKTKVHTYN